MCVLQEHGVQTLSERGTMSWESNGIRNNEKTMLKLHHVVKINAYPKTQLESECAWSVNLPQDLSVAV